MENHRKHPAESACHTPESASPAHRDRVGRRRSGYVQQCLFIALTVACLFSVSHSIEPGPLPLKVRGLYLGMPLSEAVKAVADIADLNHYDLQPFNLAAYKFRTFEGNNHKYWFSDVRTSVVSPLVFATNAEKRLTFISISGPLMDRLFPPEETAPEDFAHRFADAHGLPEMTPFRTEHESPLPNLLPDSGWRFRSPAGYKITIYSNRDLDLETIDPTN